jgi:hypothetical protein
MLLSIVTTNVWFALGVWICVYIADYALTLWGAQLYRRGAHAYLRFSGSYELNPLFERDIDQQRRLSRRFLAMLGATCATIWLAWRSTQIHLFPAVAFTFWMGVLLLMEVPALIRHAHNIFTFRALPRAPDVTGQITYPGWLTLQLSAVDCGLYALLFLVLSGVAAPWFFCGGAVGCLWLALGHSQLARRVKKSEPPRPQTDT